MQAEVKKGGRKMALGLQKQKSLGAEERVKRIESAGWRPKAAIGLTEELQDSVALHGVHALVWLL